MEPRAFCYPCHRAATHCLCEHIRPFSTPGVDWVFLQHPMERKSTVGSARMAHMSLRGSRLLMGADFSQDSELNGILQDPGRFCVVLFPGLHSQVLSPESAGPFLEGIPQGKRLTVIVIDGTWTTAKQILRMSLNLKSVPRICFSPTELSRYEFKRQPHPQCVSTVEAVHQLIQILEPGLPSAQMLDVFQVMVREQVIAERRGNDAFSSRLGESDGSTCGK